MKKLICKFFGHKPVIDENCHSTGSKCVYCKRCGADGFMQPIKQEHGEIVEYWIDE